MGLQDLAKLTFYIVMKAHNTETATKMMLPVAVFRVVSMMMIIMMVIIVMKMLIVMMMVMMIDAVDTKALRG